jgi:hypothetical protein
MAAAISTQDDSNFWALVRREAIEKYIDTINRSVASPGHYFTSDYLNGIIIEPYFIYVVKMEIKLSGLYINFNIFNKTTKVKEYNDIHISVHSTLIDGRYPAHITIPGFQDRINLEFSLIYDSNGNKYFTCRANKASIDNFMQHNPRTTADQYRLLTEILPNGFTNIINFVHARIGNAFHDMVHDYNPSREMYQKYLKYKQKYLELKKKLNK